MSINDKLARIAKLYEFDRTKVYDVDLSSSILHDWRVVDSTFENCAFDDAKLAGFRSYSAVFKRCRFKSSVLRGATLGAHTKGRRTGSLYEDCDFSGADLRDISTEHGRFARCAFVSSQWSGTQTLSAVFEHCDFCDAEINEVYFDGRRFDSHGLAGLGENKMEGCDFSTSRLEYTGFLAIDFRNLIPPRADRYVLVGNFPSKVEIALDRLKANGSREAAGLAFMFQMEFTAAKVMPPDAVGMLDFGRLSDTDARLLAAVFEIER